MFLKYLNIAMLIILTAFCDVLFANTKTIIVKPAHPEFSISLPSNPTTGYSWSLKPYNKKLLSLIKHQYIKPTNNLMGAHGYEIWIFKANAKFYKNQKATSLMFLYERPWEKNISDTSTVYQILPARTK